MVAALGMNLDIKDLQLNELIAVVPLGGSN